MHRAGAAKSRAAAELAALQIQFVPQHPKQRHVAIDIDRLFHAIYLNDKHHVRGSSINTQSDSIVASRAGTSAIANVSKYVIRGGAP